MDNLRRDRTARIPAACLWGEPRGLGEPPPKKDLNAPSYDPGVAEHTELVAGFTTSLIEKGFTDEAVETLGECARFTRVADGQTLLQALLTPYLGTAAFLHGTHTAVASSLERR
jgi:hypothetical protein